MMGFTGEKVEKPVNTNLKRDLEVMQMIVVGIPSYNNADTIRKVAEVAAEGLRKYFSGKGILVNSDGGSSDGTRETFMNSETENIEKVSFEYRGIPGKGSAMRAIFEYAENAGADAIVFLDSDLRSVEPWWIDRLAGPIVSGDADYIAPYYLRHKYDGTITNHICYPMTSALYGKKIRQPIGGDFGVGRKAYTLYLKKPKDVWKTNVARFGIDIWMTTTAIASGLEVVQAALGVKIHDVKDPGKHLSPMFVQVVSTLFSLMIEHEDMWKSSNGIERVPVVGESPNVEPEEIAVDLENLKNKAREEVENLDFISGEILNHVRSEGVVNTEEWVETVQSFALTFRKEEISVEKMIPFYFARVASFVEETQGMSTEEAEEIIEEQLNMFMEKKEELIERW